VFSELKAHLVRVWQPPTAMLYLNKVARVFLICDVRKQGQGCVHMVKTYVRRRTYANTGR